MHAFQAGSNTAVSRQPRPDFVPTQLDNALACFGVFEQGFNLWDCATTCSADTLFPISGPIDLHGGSLFLTRNLVLSSDAQITSMGNIYGNGRRVLLPPVPTTLSATSSTALPTFASYDAGDFISSCDWSSSGSYVLVGTNSSPEIVILYYDGITLTVTQRVDTDGIPAFVRWQPNTLNFVVGPDNKSNKLKTYTLSVASGKITKGSSINFSSNEEVHSLVFNRSGIYIALGKNKKKGNNARNQIIIYAADSDGTLSSISSIDIPNQQQNLEPNTLSWSPQSTKLVVGAEPMPSTPDLYFYSFDGRVLTQTSAFTTGLSVKSIDWSPSGTHIALALDGERKQRISAYRSLTSLNSQLTYYITQADDIVFYAWSPDSTKLLTGLALTNNAAPLRLYNFDSTTTTLSLNSTITFNSDITSIAWHPNGAQFSVAAGSNVYIGGAYSNGFCFTIDRLTIELQQNLTLNAPLALFNSCIISGNNHTLDFTTTGSLIIQPGANLLLKNITLKNLSGKQLSCVDNTATLSLDNVKFLCNGDYFFDAGSFHVVSSFSLSGTNAFIYRSTAQSMIYSYARMMFDYGITLSYAPFSALRTGISFADATSSLMLSGVTLYSTATGLRLTKGTIFIDGTVTVKSKASVIPEGIALGDGISSSNDARLVILPGARLAIAQGYLTYDNLS